MGEESNQDFITRITEEADQRRLTGIIILDDAGPEDPPELGDSSSSFFARGRADHLQSLMAYFLISSSEETVGVFLRATALFCLMRLGQLKTAMEEHAAKGSEDDG